MSTVATSRLQYEGVPAVEIPPPSGWPGGSESAVAAILVALLAGMWLGRASRAGNAAHRLLPADKPDGFLPEGAPVGPFLSADSDSPLAYGEFFDATMTRFCPVCRSEYIAETVTCEDCGVELVDEDEVPESEVEIQEAVVRVARIGNSIHGQLVRQFLAANRVPCSIQRCTPWDVLGADIYVFESDALRAKKLIRHFLSQLEMSPV